MTALIERTRETSFPRIVAVIVGSKCFLEPNAGGRSDGTAWIARLRNERGAIAPLLKSFPDLEWTELKFQSSLDTGSFSVLARNCVTTVRRILRLVRRLDSRYDYFKVLRVVALIAYYSRYLSIFQNARFRLGVTSNHSNPHGIGFNLAARKCGVPVALITHGMPVRPVARLSYDLSVVHCEAARQTYRDEGCLLGKVFVHGQRQHFAPMPESLPERLVLGVFLCKEVNEPRLHALVDRLLADARVSRILVRPHPMNLWVGLDAWIASRGDPRLSRSTGGPASGDIKTTDIVLAGNSTVLVEAVTAGRPGAFVPGLDYGAPDMHEFVARGLIYPLNDALDFDPDAMMRFYRRPDWLDVLRLFANVDEDEASVLERAGAALRQLTDHISRGGEGPHRIATRPTVSLTSG